MRGSKEQFLEMQQQADVDCSGNLYQEYLFNNFDNRQDLNDPQEERDVYLCSECDAEMDSDKGVCSTICHKANMM
ncbi:MAG: hypothetical protein QM499_01255 [Flavobacteriaceae bacterium]